MRKRKKTDSQEVLDFTRRKMILGRIEQVTTTTHSMIDQNRENCTQIQGTSGRILDKREESHQIKETQRIS